MIYAGGSTREDSMPNKFKRFDPGALGLRLGAFVVSLVAMLAGLAGRKYAFFRDELAFHLERSRHIYMCYAIGPGMTPEWDVVDALPSATEALVLVTLAGLVGLVVPKKWRVTLPWAKKTDARQLRERLLDEGRFPDDVAQQLED